MMNQKGPRLDKRIPTDYLLDFHNSEHY